MLNLFLQWQNIREAWKTWRITCQKEGRNFITLSPSIFCFFYKFSHFSHLLFVLILLANLYFLSILRFIPLFVCSLILSYVRSPNSFFHSSIYLFISPLLANSFINFTFPFCSFVRTILSVYFFIYLFSTICWLLFSFITYSTNCECSSTKLSFLK